MRVAVIGSGPAGAAAAIELARGGASVRLFEKARWPRPKTCGDGISPPGVGETSRLGIALGDRPHLAEGEIVTPGGVMLRSGWRPETPWGTALERRDFDARLVDEALRAGAAFEDGTAVREIAVSDGTPPSVRLTEHGAPERFDAVVLAEGATGTLAPRLGYGRHRSRLVAIRGYATARRPLEPIFGLYFERGVAPGYGWIFPLDERRANVGILVDEGQVRRNGGNVRGLLDAWLARSPFARDALGDRPVLDDLRGGVIPTGRRRRAGRGVYLVGDAAGVADPFSAEGISQAIATGRAAGRALLAAGGERVAAERAYRAALRPFDRNAREAQRLRLGFAYVMDPLARRAQTRPELARHLSANGLFMKESLGAFLWGIVRAW